MERAPFQLSVLSMIGLVACVALNIGVFRYSVFWGIVCLNVTKHIVIAYLCQIVGVDRTGSRRRPRVAEVPAPPVTVS